MARLLLVCLASAAALNVHPPACALHARARRDARMMADATPGAETAYSAEDREELMAARFPAEESQSMVGQVVPATVDMTQLPPPPAESPPPEEEEAALEPVEWLGPFGGLVEGTPLARPSYLDGTLAGDAGFDPLGFVVDGLPNGMPSTFGNPSPSKSALRANLMWMREAEVKHARLAMLAAAGWPLAELWHGPLAQITGLPFALDGTEGRSPSLLNGHLGDYWGFLAVATLGMAAVEVSTLDQVYGITRTGMTMSKKSGQKVQLSYVPGDLGFDPLGLYGVLGNSVPAMLELRMQNEPQVKLDWDAYQRKQMEAWEIYHGRAAMLGITGFAVQELITGAPVVDQTPQFFTPFWELLAPGAVASLGIFPQ